MGAERLECQLNFLAHGSVGLGAGALGFRLPKRPYEIFTEHCE